MSVERSDLNVERSAPRGAVFLSYASQDAEAAKRICEALRAAGIEVWFDQSELVGGDAWDQKIRRQIKDCALLIPIISAATQARTEGYFRLEWRLADQRTHLMAKGRPFLLPVVIDDTRDAEAHVPDSFTEVQWTRVPGGETPPAFAARVKKLLGGDGTEDIRLRQGYDGQGRQRSAVSGRPTNNQEPITNNRAKPRWLAPVIGGAAVALLALVISRPWEKARSPSDAAKPAEAVKPAIPMTEAQKLVAQARKIYEDGDELNRENLYLAEELVQRALKLDSAEPTAWEFSAWLSYLMVWHLIDESPERRENLLRQASRAVALAPDSVAAQLVYANAQMAGRLMVRDFGQSHLEETEQSLLRLAEREPQNWKIQRALGTTFRMMNRTDDAIRTLERAKELSNDHPMAVADLVNLLIRRQRFAEADALLARALPRQRSGRLLTFDVVVKCRWRGDTVGALKAIETWPVWLLQENRGLAVAWQAGFWGRQPEAALRVVQRFPREEVRDINFAGPRAALSARAHELAGDTAAAQADWRVVEERCTQALAVNSQDIVALHWKAWALARLGDQAGAQAAATLMRQHMRSVASSFFNVNTVAPLWATVGWTDLALTELRTLLEAPVDGYSLTRAYLELEPAFDPLRQDPRFKELVASAPAPKPDSPPVSGLQSSSSPSPVDSKSVAVLAFANLSDDKSNEYFSDGISEELLNVLAKVPGLKVTARTSSFHFKGMNTAIPEIARELGVAYVVEGSVRKAGDKVRITAQLIKAADGFHVWSDTFTRDLKDIFAVQDEIAGLIAQNLELKLGMKPAARAVNPEAYALYLQAIQGWNQRYAANRPGLVQTEATLQRAIALDPEFAPAHALLSSVTYYLGSGGSAFAADGTMQPGLAAATAQAEQAVRLAPDSAEAHAALGLALAQAYREEAAEAEYRRAIETGPSYALARARYARLLEVEGRMDEALDQMRRSVELNPLYSRAFDNFALMLTHAGRREEALAAAERSIALAPENVQAKLYQTLLLFALGRGAEADVAGLQAITSKFDVTKSPDVPGYLCAVLLGTGQRPAAEAVYARIPAELPGERAYAAVVLGRPEEARKIFAASWLPKDWMDEFLWNPLFDPLRDSAEFGAMLRRHGLVEAQARVQAWRAAHPPEKPEGKK